jgi:hypothetical protein
MEAGLETFLLGLAMAGAAVYTGYMIEKRREEIRRTIQVIDLKDTEFWEGLSELRHVVAPVKH